MTSQPLPAWTPRIGTLILGAVLLIAGCDQGTTPPEDDENTGAEVTVAENDSLGAYLADVDGASLYLFTDGNGNPVTCTGQCAEAWPPFVTDGDPVANGSVDASMLSTMERSDGSTQVVYNGWPLFYFVNDQAPGDVNGQGIESFGGTWLLVSPSGEQISGAGGSDDNDDSDDDDDDSRY